MIVAPVAYLAMFTGFRTYDDEGYFLLVVRDYVSGQPMLGPATPIYGPFFYEANGAVFKLLGLTPGHDAGRYLTLGIWLLASLLAGWAAYRLTRSLGLAIGAELVAFQALIALTYEPMSPQALIALLVVGVICVASFHAARPRVTALLIGGIVAALLLIKINVGLFAGLAVGLAFAALLPSGFRRWALPAMVVAVTLLPLALTAGLASQAWALEFGIEVAFAAAAVGATLVRAHLQPAPPGDLWSVAAGAGGVAVVSLGIAVAGGTTVADLWSGVVVVPLRFPSIFSAPLEMNAALDVLAVASCAAAVFIAIRAGVVSPAVRVAVGLAMWIAVLLLPASLYLFTLPLTWIAAVRPSGQSDDPTGGLARVLVPALAVVAALQVYPVAGTQQSIAALPQVFAGAICLADATRVTQAKGFAIVATAVGALTLLIHAAFAVPAYQQAEPLGLPGAKTMRLQPAQAAQVRAAVSALDQDCAAFITYPGLESFYLWTNQSPPTDLRSEVWMITYDEGQQQSVVDRLRGQSRLCVLESRHEIDFWARGRPIAQRPLVEFIDQEFTPAGTFGEYVLLVRRPV